MKRILILVLFLISSSTYACTCLYSEFGIKDYENAAYVIEGKVLKVEINKNQREKTITFKVRRRIKGETDRIIKISTGISSAACGLNVNKNDKWLLFVSEYNGRLNVGTCGKNVRFNKRKGESKEQRKKRRKLRKKMISKMKEFKKPSYNEQ